MKYHIKNKSGACKNIRSALFREFTTITVYLFRVIKCNLLLLNVMQKYIAAHYPLFTIGKTIVIVMSTKKPAGIPTGLNTPYCLFTELQTYPAAGH